MTPTARLLTFIRFSHTVFALPFALGAMLAAARGIPSPKIVALILLAMVFARTAAMSFNRVADWEIDKRNPRTEGRHRLMSLRAAKALVAGSSLAFIGTTYGINPLCFLLSPLALAIVFFYSLTKRFTHWTQAFLGLALAVSPVGAWLAVTGRPALAPFVLAAGVLCWVAGFDLIYATMDYEFDRREGLHSLVVKFGVPRALRLAQALHVALFGALIAFGATARLGPGYYVGLALVLGALIYEHRSASAQPPDVGAVNRAFFLSNAFVGAVFVAAVAAGIWF